MGLALPIIPLKTVLRIGGGFLEQLAHAAKIVLLPRSLERVHVGKVEVALDVGALLIGALSSLVGPLRRPPAGVGSATAHPAFPLAVCLAFVARTACQMLTVRPTTKTVATAATAANTTLFLRPPQCCAA